MNYNIGTYRSKEKKLTPMHTNRKNSKNYNIYTLQHNLQTVFINITFKVRLVFSLDNTTMFYNRV